MAADFFVTPDGINIISRTSDPVSPKEGTFWHRSDTNDIRFHVNGTITILPLTIGDMTVDIYDPTTVAADAFSMDSMVETVTSKVLTEFERAKIAALTGLEAKIKSGTYLGDDTTANAITGVGFQPIYVKVWRREVGSGVIVEVFETSTDIIDDNTSGMSIDMTGTMTGKRPESIIDAIISLDADGFTVDDGGSDSHPNTSGVIYNYLAMG